MAQNIQFVYLSQSEYDGLNSSRSPGRLYFTSDTHRIYKGDDLYAATTFDQLDFREIQVSSMIVNGSQVSLEGHGHQMSEIEGLESAALQLSMMATAMSGISESTISKTSATFQDLTVTGDVTFSVDQLDFQSLTASSLMVNGSQVALEGHTHSFGDVDGLSSHVSQVTASISTFNEQLQGITQNGISKTSATFGDLTITGELTCSLDQVQFGSIVASDITVNGSSVSLEGHTHSTSDINGLDQMLSGYASASHSHAISDITNLSTILEGITQSEVTKSRVSASAGVFDQISAESATFSSITVQVADFTTTRVSAQVMTVGGSNVSIEGHTHGMSEIDGLESLATTLSGITESTIAKASATFQDLVVTGDVTFSVDQLDFQSLTASSISVNGSSVALEGHVHSASDISDFSDAVVSAGTSAFASASHSHDGLQGLTSSSITKDFASFNSISASTATFDNLVVIGDVTMSLSQVQFGSIVASDISVNGSQVSLEGHVHAMSEIDGLESSINQLNASISAFALAMSGLDVTSISRASATFGDLVVTGSVTFSVDQLDFDILTASTILLNGSSVAVEGHLHSISDVTGLGSVVSAMAAYESRIAALESMVSGLEQALQSINTGA